MATDGRERMGDVSEFLLLLGERLAEAAYRVRVEAIKAARLSRVRMEMVMLRRERRAAIFRLGEAALEAVRDGRVADPVLAARAREVDDASQALEAKAEEAGRISDLPDEEILERSKRRASEAGLAGESTLVDEPPRDPEATVVDGATPPVPPSPPRSPL